jgi:acetyl-CoA carboxylase biotin carboxyl carrier protein
MDLALIERLFALLDQSTAEELEVTENGVTIRISKRASGASLPAAQPAPGTAQRPDAPQAAASPRPVRSDDRLAEIRAGMTGTFYRAASPDAAPFVAVGTVVRDGDRMALIEAMKTFNPVEADCDGTIVEIVAQDGALVEAGSVLFRIERA